MGATTGIEWAHSTVNIWTGCTKVSPACKHCYAETSSPVRAMEVRIGDASGVEPNADGKRRLKMWGVDGFRYETANWERELRALNRKAKAAREQHENAVRLRHPGAFKLEPYERPRVFINSLSDIFEDWQGPVYRLEDGKPVVVRQSLNDVRARFFRVAEECTDLDILLLTKRPENVLRMVPALWFGPMGKWPSHVWLGTTVEDQEHADKRIPELLKVPAKVRFLSVEPLLGRVDLERHLWQPWEPSRGPVRDKAGSVVPMAATGHVHWVIVGGESGHGDSIRPMHPDWVRSIRDQCIAAGVSFFFKQWGEYHPCAVQWYQHNGTEHVSIEIEKRPEMRIPKRPKYRDFGDGVGAVQVGKKNAGRLLDGREWNEVPK